MAHLAFECFQCGECCRNLGYVHVIRETLGDYRFLVENTYTCEKTLVTIDPDKHELFDDTSIFEKIPHTCPFFRHPPGSERAYCTVHLTRPDLCRGYECWRLLIIDHAGRKAGRIEYVRSLISEDPHLKPIWEMSIERIEEPDDRKWEDAMIRILRQAGYSVRR